jgi:hypothetical protein
MADYSNGAYFEDLDYVSNTIGGVYFFEPGVLTPLTEMAPFFPDDTSIGLDESYGEGIIFYYPTKQGVTDTVTFKGQWLPIEPRSTFNQTIQKSGAGKLSVYNSTFQDKILVIHLDLVPLEKRQRLWIFLHNITVGALKRFEYEDETGVVYTVRCIDKTLKYPMKYWLKHVITVNLYVEGQMLP